MARQASARHASAAAAERRAQADLLAAYRTRRDAREALERDALAAKLHAQWGAGSAGAWEVLSGGAAWQRQGDDAWASAETRARTWTRVLQQHESRWAALAASADSSPTGGESSSSGGGPETLEPCPGGSSATCIGYAEVPWPPLGCEEYLLGLAAWEQQQQQAGQVQARDASEGCPAVVVQRAQRRAYARACLRWHPDKFVARWGPRLEPADRDRILERVQALSQGLNEAWDALQRRAEAGGGDG